MVVLTQKEFSEAAAKTLWRPELEKDACGVGFVASVKGISTHKVSN